MLKSLKFVDQNTSLDVLTSLVGALLPSAFDENRRHLDPNAQKIYDGVLAEAEIKAKSIEYSMLAREPAILKILSSEISEISLKGKETGEFKKSLGRTGVLSPVLYRPVFQPNFSSEVAVFGIRKNQVEEVLAKPDRIARLGYGDQQAVHVYLKNIESRDHISQVIVFAQRQDDTIIVHNAWRHYSGQYSSDVLRTLEQFVEAFGLFIRLNGSEKKLYANCQVPMIQDYLKHDSLGFQVIQNGVQKFSTVCSYRGDPDKKIIDIAVLFAINDQAYANHILASKDK